MALMRETPTLSFVGTVVVVDDAYGQTDLGQYSAEVRVDEVVRSPPVLPDITGSTVTVLFADTHSVATGRRYLFNAVGASYGKQLVVRAIDVAAQEGRATGAARALNADPHLVDQVRTAEAIVTGELVRRAPARRGARLTEHDPALSIASIRVIDVVKGHAPAVIDVALPTSTDVLWPQSTVPNEGDTVIFFLGRSVGAAGGKSSAYMVNDVQPIDAVDRVRSIVAQF
jgi:hypothetical protein